MAKTLQFRRGTSSELDTITGAEGELFVDLDTNSIRVHDGVTSGGIALATESYVQNQVYSSSDFDTDFGTKNTDNLTEGTTNKYFSNALARSAVSASGDLSYNSSTGVFSVTVPAGYDSGDFNTDFGGKDTDDLTEGTTNKYYADSLVDGHLSGGTGVTYSGGSISIGQAVDTTSNVTFNNVSVNGTLSSDDITASTVTTSGDLVVQGNLTINGTTTTVNSTTVEIGDNIFVLNSDLDGATAPSQNAGFTINRGSSADKSFIWDETSDVWTVAGDTFVAGAINTGNITSSGTVTAVDFNSTSDERLKENVENIENGLDVISQIRPVSFDWKDSGEKSFGVIAQEIEQILPQVVATNDEGIKSVGYDKIIAFLIDAVKTLDERTR